MIENELFYLGSVFCDNRGNKIAGPALLKTLPDNIETDRCERKQPTASLARHCWTYNI